jgi:serine/threonine-protein kinase
VLAVPLAASGTARQRFAREARAAAVVRDEHVVAIYAVRDDSPVPYLVMEFIDGCNLETLLRGAGRWKSKKSCASACRSPAAWRRRTSKG